MEIPEKETCGTSVLETCARTAYTGIRKDIRKRIEQIIRVITADVLAVFILLFTMRRTASKEGR